MARKKCKCPEPGAPTWVVTYGDMMSLLLVFFIMLFAVSEIVQEDKFKSIVEEIRESFGMKGGGGKLPTDEDPRLSLLEVLDEMQEEQANQDERGQAHDRGMEGRELEVTQIREGQQYIVGGRITFEPGSADLDEQARRQLRQAADLIRGYNNVVELRGHADADEARASAGRRRDLWDLSHARARAVKEFLTHEDVGIRPERIRLVANADREPLVRRVYTSSEREPNRRVELMVIEALVSQFQEPQ